MGIARVEALLAMGARRLPSPVAAISSFALARCTWARTDANGSARLPGWPAWPASPWAADGPGWPWGPLGAIGVDRHRAVGTVRTLRPVGTRTVRALRTSRSVRRRPIGPRSAIALGGAGASAIVVAVRGRTGSLGRTSWSPRTALVVAAPVGTTVATFWAGPGTGACELRGDSGSDWGRDELDAARVRTLGSTGCLDRDDGDALDAELRLGTHDVACFCPTIKKSSIESAARV
jgi:hypothetical protein